MFRGLDFLAMGRSGFGAFGCLGLTVFDNPKPYTAWVPLQAQRTYRSNQIIRRLGFRV